MDAEMLIPLIIVPVIFIGLPWIIFHYITKWKAAATLTREDEDLLDELHDVARRLDERMCSIERILAAENPNWRQIACDPVSLALDERRSVEPELTKLRSSNQPARRPR
jgi:phage shock protein B